MLEIREYKDNQYNPSNRSLYQSFTALDDNAIDEIVIYDCGWGYGCFVTKDYDKYNVLILSSNEYPTLSFITNLLASSISSGFETNIVKTIMLKNVMESMPLKPLVDGNFDYLTFEGHQIKIKHNIRNPYSYGKSTSSTHFQFETGLSFNRLKQSELKDKLKKWIVDDRKMMAFMNQVHLKKLAEFEDWFNTNFSSRSFDGRFVRSSYNSVSAFIRKLDLDKLDKLHRKYKSDYNLTERIRNEIVAIKNSEKTFNYKGIQLSLCVSGYSITVLGQNLGLNITHSRLAVILAMIEMVGSYDQLQSDLEKAQLLIC